MDRETLEQRTIFPQGTLIKTSLDLSLKAAIRPAFVTDGVVVGNIIHNYPFGAATTASRNTTTTTTTTTTHHHQDDEGSIPRFSNDSVTKHRTAKRERDNSTPGVAVRRPLNSPLLARPSISTVRVIKSERSILQRCDTPCVQLREEVGKAWARKANALERARESRREYIDETRRVRMCV